MKRILVEGWRGIFHSFAMVNQYQLLELVRRPDLELRVRDLAYLNPSWANGINDPGFPQDSRSVLAGMALDDGGPIDVAYRIAYPFRRSEARSARAVTFMVTEIGLAGHDFVPGHDRVDTFCSRDDLVVTPSAWSKAMLIEYGFPDEKVRVVPHGVDSNLFHPLSADEHRRVRAGLGLAGEDFVFLNIGSLTSNKGLPLLVDAFTQIRLHYPNARLILKDSAGLFGLGVDAFLKDYAARFGDLPVEVSESIYQAPSAMSLAEMRLLYGAADCYVSPYRAEGFNLPVIESIVCGTPAIVTAGGPTDDFCCVGTALRIPSDRVPNSAYDSPVPGFHLEPNFDNLLEDMERAITGSAFSFEAFEAGRQRIISDYSWKAASEALATLL